jgi:hypothetical protein
MVMHSTLKENQMAKVGANSASAVRATMRGVRLTDTKYTTVEKA